MNDPEGAASLIGQNQIGDESDHS